MKQEKIITENGWKAEKRSLEELEAKYTADASDIGVTWTNEY